MTKTPEFRIALAQLNPTVGDVAGNAAKARAARAFSALPVTSPTVGFTWASVIVN